MAGSKPPNGIIPLSSSDNIDYIGQYMDRTVVSFGWTGALIYLFNGIEPSVSGDGYCNLYSSMA